MAARWGFGLLVSGVFLTPYAQFAWWPFPVSTLLLFLLFRLWSRERRRKLGLDLDRGALARAGLLLAVAAGLSWVVLQAIAREGGVTFRPFGLPLAVYPLFQALHEEVVLGYLPLRWLLRRGAGPAAAAIGLAAFFALLHVLLYGLGLYRTWLGLPTIASLILVGLLRNVWILGTGHVGGAWALHAGWNLCFLGGAWLDDGSRLGEPRTFDIFLGHPYVLVAFGLAVLLSDRWFRRRMRMVPADPFEAGEPPAG